MRPAHTKNPHQNPAKKNSADIAESIPRKQPTVVARPNFGRHAAKCRVCVHPQRQEIEGDFIAWKNPDQIAQEYGLADRSSVYRHAHALNLFRRRRRNVRAALELIIERVSLVKVNAGAVVAAVQALAKINTRGEWFEREEHTRLDDFLDRMTPEECGKYAKDGILPDWFRDEIIAAGGRVPKADEDE